MSANTSYQAVLLFGGPGSGKGTQGKVLDGMPNLLHLAMGDIFRALDKKSEIGREFLSYSTKGLLVPDELTVRVWKAHVEGMERSGTFDPSYHVLLLDGIPRTPAQVELLRSCLTVLRVVHFAVADEQALVARLKGRALQADRPDDADEDVIRHRLTVYREETTPVLQALSPDLVSEIDADQAPLAVLRDLAEVLTTCVPARI